MYAEVRGAVRIAGKCSREFVMEKGVKQGDSLSPLLFVIFMNQVIKQCRRRTGKMKVGNWMMRPIYVQSLVYADDIVILAGKEEQLQEALTEWAHAFQDRGMEVNVSKTKVMQFTKGEEVQLRIKWKNEIIEQVDQFEYLGTIFRKDGKLEAELNNRIRKANQVYYSINNTIIGKQEISRVTKMRVYNAVYLPTLVYGAESWTLHKKLESRLVAAEMRYLRKAVGKTRRDHIRNNTVREELKQEPIKDIVERRGLGWLGHLARMNEGRKAKEVWRARPTGRRTRGRPRIEWEEYITGVVRRRGKTLGEVQRMAQDRGSYKKWLKAP